MYNKTILIGNLTKEIEMIDAGNIKIAKSSIASSYKYKTSSGEQKEDVCFLDFTIFGNLSNVANMYLKKGSRVLLEGRLVLEQWVAQDGTNRSKHSLRVDTMKMLGDNKDNKEKVVYDKDKKINTSFKKNEKEILF
jgi:single-strand DNA-binding protein